jgi:kynurenine formamidase
MKPGIFVLSTATLILFAMAALTNWTRNAVRAADANSHTLISQAQLDRWETELSNWGRWGKKDELGTLNLVTPAKRKQAAALVREGLSVSLASNIPTEKAEDVPCPAQWEMLSLNLDKIAFPCIHGPGITHLDSFAHVYYHGKMWNGDLVSEVVTKEHGPTKSSIIAMKDGIVTRGVLYDMARLKGVPYLEPGTRIYAEDLEAWEKISGAKAGPGDVLLLGWGRWVRRAKVGPWPIVQQTAGLDNSVIPWLKKRDIAILGWETPGYNPKPEGDVAGDQVHNFALTILGIHILDRADLTAVSEAAAARKRWEFMVTIAPLPIPHGTGSPVNPIAVF